MEKRDESTFKAKMSLKHTIDSEISEQNLQVSTHGPRPLSNRKPVDNNSMKNQNQKIYVAVQ